MSKSENNKKLREAAEKGDSEELSVILTQGNVDVNCRNIYGVLPIHLAVESGSVECTDMLIKHGSHINPKGHNAWLPIHLAAMNGSVRCLDLLIKHGSHINTQDADGNLPIHRAIANRHIEVVDLLIKHGSHINTRNNGGQTPLHKTSNGFIEAARLLIEHGCDPTIKDNPGKTAAGLAHVSCEYEVCHLIKQYQDKMEESGLSPEVLLLKRCEADDWESVEKLLTQPVDVNYIGDSGNSALHLASKAGIIHIVEILLNKGSNPTLKNKNGIQIVLLSVYALQSEKNIKK